MLHRQSNQVTLRRNVTDPQLQKQLITLYVRRRAIENKTNQRTHTPSKCRRWHRRILGILLTNRLGKTPVSKQYGAGIRTQEDLRIGSRRHADPFASSRHPSSTRALRQIHSSIGLTAQCRWGICRSPRNEHRSSPRRRSRAHPSHSARPGWFGRKRKSPDYVSNRRLNLV